MKKSFKMLALGLAVVPCALMLTACGGEQDLVNIKGDYVDLQTTEYNAVVESIDQSFDINEIANGVKARIKIDASANMGAFGNIELSMDSEEIIKANVQNNQLLATNLEAYMKSSVYMKATATYGEEELVEEVQGTAKQYLRNGVQYVDLSGAKNLLDMVDIETPLKSYQILSTGDSEPLTIPEISLTEFFALIPEGEIGESVVLSKSETETGYKIKMVADKVLLNEVVGGFLQETSFAVEFQSDAEMYMVFENEQFGGLYFDTDAILNVSIPSEHPMYQIIGSTLSVNLSINAQLVGFSGDIQYPNFSGYVNMSEE